MSESDTLVRVFRDMLRMATPMDVLDSLAAAMGEQAHRMLTEGAPRAQEATDWRWLSEQMRGLARDSPPVHRLTTRWRPWS